ncbi:response regulator transcription factor [Acanthopleuribacter pedis]|uniref:Response regulator n=1 Tax=Acanthopleuribacter pedis TaxID=442870 RepID=A0A8J7Q911_9BACT|nr:response regulator [Acanthopleuribacter pedis]MBO1320806.1 response regulator [Acanthopleuribacter pedis]
MTQEPKQGSKQVNEGDPAQASGPDQFEDTVFHNRILICDDNRDIHKDIQKILSPVQPTELDQELRSFEDALFSDDPAFTEKAKKTPDIRYRIDSAFQGKQALEMVEKAADDNDPYTLVFMDVRMPPGWDGIRTVDQIWRRFPFTEVVIVTAYSDYTWDEMVQKLGVNDKLLFIKKPFDSLEVKQLALNLTTKWNTAYRAQRHVEQLQNDVHRRVEALTKTLHGM